MNTNKVITQNNNRFLSIASFIICMQSLEVVAFPDDSTINGSRVSSMGMRW